ncbi:MAG: hypothetical protein K1X29_11630 [Bdellovibrionales bacterium]|nr:hypothetical protein [Bdellovibrionales bacterium]
MSKPNKVNKKILPTQKNNQTSWAMFFILLLLSFALFLILSDNDSTQKTLVKGESSSLNINKKILNLINKNLQSTEQKIEHLSLLSELENNTLESLTKSKESDLSFSNSNLQSPLTNPFESEDRSGRVFNDLNPKIKYDGQAPSPQDRVASLVEQEQWLKKYENKQRELFVKQFLNNAKAAGYNIKLNSNLQVIGVERIPNSDTSATVYSNPESAKLQ